MSIFKTQGLIKFSLETGQTLSGASTLRILYEKPDKTKGHWTATANGTKVEYQAQDGDLDQTGTWLLQAYIVIGGKTGFGEIVETLIDKPINL